MNYPQWIEDAGNKIASHVNHEYPNIGAPMAEKFMEIIDTTLNEAATQQWLTGLDVFGFKVEKREIPRPGNKPYYVIPESSQIGVLHTTEGKTLESALAQFSMRHDPPHFLVGQSRIIQCRPVGVQAAALHDPANRDAYIQIEQVAFSKQVPWLPVSYTLNPAVAIMAYCAKQKWVPLEIPNNWPDDCSDMKGTTWASNNKRRKQAEAGLWPAEKGWWSHLSVPYQGPSWHWDAGAIELTKMIEMAAKFNQEEATIIAS